MTFALNNRCNYKFNYKLNSRIISLFLCVSILSSSYFAWHNEYKAFADGLAGALAITSGIFAEGSGAALTATISAAAPYALALAAAGLAAGCIYKNRQEIGAFIGGAIHYLEGVGEGVGVGLRRAKDGAIYMTSSAKTAFLNYMNTVGNGYYQFKSFCRNTVVPAGQTVWTNFRVLLSENMNFALKVVQAGSNVRLVFKTNDGTVLPANLESGQTPSASLYFSRDGWFKGFKYGSLPNSYRGESISVGFENYGSFDTSVSLDHITNYGASSVCPSTTNTYGATTPFANSVDATKVIGANTGVSSWDNVIGKTYDDVIGKTGAVENVPTKDMEADIDDTNTGTIEDDIAISLDEAIANELVDEIEGTFDNPFKDSLKSIEQMDTSQGVPPKIYFNLHDLFDAATSRFMDQNPFPDKETVLIDFEMINNYKFNGIPLIDFFRGIVGFGFIFTTLLYCLRKFSPDSVI